MAFVPNAAANILSSKKQSMNTVSDVALCRYRAGNESVLPICAYFNKPEFIALIVKRLIFRHSFLFS